MDLSKLRVFRENNKVTQYEISRAIGISPAAYRMWENQVATPSDANMAKLDAFVAKVEAESGVR